MSTKILKTSMLALAGAVALASGIAQADPIDSDYLVCTYKGSTQLTLPPALGGTSTACWLTATMKMNCDSPNHFHIVAAGPIPGSEECSSLYLGNFPWGGDLADITGTPGVIDTNHTGNFPYSVIHGGVLQPIAGGQVDGVLGSMATTNFACDTNTVQVPDFVSISGSGNFGPFPGATDFATLNTTGANGMRRLSCEYIVQ